MRPQSAAQTGLSVPAAYVRALGLAVQRLKQSYRRLPNEDRNQRLRLSVAPLQCPRALGYDPTGLVPDYPGIGVRVD
ncbi:MAG TPA: putative glycolipid-binding domain-containing protein [Propionibacteriaceae bacterium]